MRLVEFVLFIFVTKLTCGIFGQGQSQQDNVKSTKKPHIIMIVADDLGWDDVSFHGSPQIPTPTLDELANSGVILNNYYVSPMDTPTRASFMTGKYPLRLGLQHDSIHNRQPMGVPLKEKFLPEYLKDLGYHTHAVGKWQLGFFAKDYTPTSRGFDSFYGFWGSGEDYFSHVAEDGSYGLDLRKNMDVVFNETGVYGPDLFSREADKVVGRHDANQPLFLYFAQQAVHVGNLDDPLQAPRKYLDRVKHIQDERRRTYAAMVTALDESVKSLIEKLKQMGIYENSVIVFTTDNGAAAGGLDLSAGSNYPLRGAKNTVWEGGVRAVGFVHSPLIKQNRRVCKEMIHATDWLPTFYALAGGGHQSIKGIDGFNQWHAISEEGRSPRYEIIHGLDTFKGNRAALRVGEYKLIMNQDPDFYGDWFPRPADPQVMDQLQKPRLLKEAALDCTIRHPHPLLYTHAPLCNPTRKPCLFNIKWDPCEYHNLADFMPNTMKVLLDRLNFYFSEAAPVIYPKADDMADPNLAKGVWITWRFNSAIPSTDPAFVYPKSYDDPAMVFNTTGLTVNNILKKFMKEQRDKELKEKRLREQRERELQAKRDKEIQEQREKALQVQRDRELQEQREKALQAQRDRELQEQREKALQAQRDRELQEQREKALQAQRDRELQEQREKALQAQRDRKLQEQREKALQAQRDRELQEQREKELQAQRAVQLKLQREEEMRRLREKTLKLQKENELRIRKENALKALRDKQLRDQREKALRAQREQELKEQRERNLKAQRDKELREQLEKAVKAQLKEQQEKELKYQREREQMAIVQATKQNATSNQPSAFINNTASDVNTSPNSNQKQNAASFKSSENMTIKVDFSNVAKPEESRAPLQTVTGVPTQPPAKPLYIQPVDTLTNNVVGKSSVFGQRIEEFSRPLQTSQIQVISDVSAKPLVEAKPLNVIMNPYQAVSGHLRPKRPFNPLSRMPEILDIIDETKQTPAFRGPGSGAHEIPKIFDIIDEAHNQDKNIASIHKGDSSATIATSKQLTLGDVGSGMGVGLNKLPDGISVFGKLGDKLISQAKEKSGKNRGHIGKKKEDVRPGHYQIHKFIGNITMDGKTFFVIGTESKHLEDVKSRIEGDKLILEIPATNAQIAHEKTKSKNSHITGNKKSKMATAKTKQNEGISYSEITDYIDETGDEKENDSKKHKTLSSYNITTVGLANGTKCEKVVELDTSDNAVVVSSVVIVVIASAMVVGVAVVAMVAVVARHCQNARLNSG